MRQDTYRQILEDRIEQMQSLIAQCRASEDPATQLAAQHLDAALRRFVELYEQIKDLSASEAINK